MGEAPGLHPTLKSKDGGKMYSTMTLIDIFLTAFSLSLDAVAISVAAGALHRFNLRQTVKIALFFGAFQLFMPLLGWLFVSGFAQATESYGNIIGFVLLIGVGGKMLHETWTKETSEDMKNERHLAETKVLTIMAVATSIDALVVGVTFNYVSVNIPLAVCVIGIVTFALSFLGVYAGERYKHFIGRRIEAVGACIIIGLAFKILLGW